MYSPRWSLSPTQLRELREGCRRKWAWRYVAGQRPPETRSAALGTAVHAVIADLLRGVVSALSDSVLHGALEAEARAIVAPHVEVLTRLRPYVVAVEQRLVTQIEEQTDLVGVIDLVTCRDGETEVQDHKTCASSRYALTPATLRSDLQAQIYAGLWQDAHGCLPHGLRWDYYSTAGDRSRWEVASPVDGDQVNAAREVARLEAVWVRGVRDGGVEPRDVEARIEICKKYGGCPYRALCAARPSIADLQQLQEREMTPQQGSLALERLRARKAAAASAVTTDARSPNPPAPAQAPVQAPAPAPAQAPVQAPVQVPVQAPAPAPAQAPRGRGRPPGSPNKAAPCLLCVDCAPIGSTSAEDLDALLAPLCYQVASEQQVEHWQLVPYGGGVARLALAARQFFADNPPRGVLVTNSSSRVYQAVASELASYVTKIVGVR